MNIRNAEYKNMERTIIDVEIEHPKYGWIPYTFISNIPDDSFDFEIREWLNTATIKEYVKPVIPPKTEEQLKAEAKAEIARQLEVLTVTTTAGNVFDANNQARLDMQNAITASDFVGVTQITWRMADDSEVLIELAELKEALALAIQEYARIKGIGA